MKNVVIMRIQFLIILIAAALLVGCQKDDDAPGDPFLGEWEIVEAMGIAADLNIGTIYTFRDDGSLTVRLGGLSNQGTYVKSASEITITLSGIDLIYTYTLNGTTLTLDNVTSDQVFILKKR